LKDRPGYLRARVGDYRIIHTIEQGVLRVLVVRVGRRRDLYR
jgi:mRNA interferase RelE/StbE